ncbi:Mss4-like protein [Hirsutella rhossiliensis]|uniref:Mss4-like protein n=1 Tax=Hirsutella rhossiliensis TaxID=111463 RepID=A0A9P8N4Q6_9HYPO|nr:Mss4-like protein [Hirsutella rhossiliensis]KAH0966820.1 Mss4-like protein [Hirsutella rhossiliensis]
MSELRPLRGGCQCGRNRYIIAVPQDGVKEAQVLFNTEPLHQIPLATPLAAYIRVPLSWYHSTTFAFFPDETHTMIRRVYTHPSQEHSKRHFCGFCGTPLSYWSESPLSEADYINLTIGSLLRDDLRDLEDMGLIPDELDDDAGGRDRTPAPATPTRSAALRESFGVPWFDGLVEGTRLGNMRRAQGVKRSHDGRVSVEWEIVEYAAGSDSDADMETESASSSGKRKMQDRED